MTDNNECMFGIAAEFEDDQSLLEAARKARAAGYKEVRAYSPYYIEGLAETLKQSSNVIFTAVVVMIFVGAAFGFLLQFWTDVVDYPINVGGRPFNSWPSFLILTFEFGIMFGGITAFVGFLAKTALPLPYHPIFNTPNFELASRSRFFLCIQVTDKQFSVTKTTQFLESLEPANVSEVSC